MPLASRFLVRPARVALTALVATATTAAIAASAFAPGDAVVSLEFAFPARPPIVAKTAPPCDVAVDFSRLLADRSSRDALISGIGQSAQSYGSLQSTLAKAGVGPDQAGIVRRNGGTTAQCQSGCVVLPARSRVRRMTLFFDTRDRGGLVIEPGPEDTREVGDGWAPTESVGYDGLQSSDDGRAVCLNAKSASSKSRRLYLDVVFGR